MTWVIVYRPCKDVAEYQNAFAKPVPPLPKPDPLATCLAVAKQLLLLAIRVVV